MVNRNPVSQFFITYPQWVEYESPKKLLDFLPPCKWAYIVQESHDDGGIHYHVACIVKNKITLTKMILYCKATFPNDWKRIKVEIMQSISGAIDYCDKESLIKHEHGVRPRSGVVKQNLTDRLLEEMLNNVSEIERHRQLKLEMDEYKECEYRHWCLSAGVPYEGWLEYPNVQ